MARVFPREGGKRLSLPGRASTEIVSGRLGTERVSLRLVEIAVPKPGEKQRGPHIHTTFEECIFVVEGEGCTVTEEGRFPLKSGDTILIAAGELHVTHNTGQIPLKLLCFFPEGDVAAGTKEFPDWSGTKAAS